NYYTSKEEIFRDVIVEVEKDLTTVAPADELDAYRNPVSRLRAANRAYVRGYRRNAALISLLPQMRDSNDEIHSLGRSIIVHFQDRVAAAIERWQREGLVYPDLDATYTAHALTFMTERLVVVATTRMYEFDYDEERLLDTVNKVWERTLGFDRFVG
ncbi:MAG: TetR/AcrR family transcriptional regulator, partial [Aldersonia sp.]|nr:TetR/AcrR family transcriptional regulator [Aldersonia sp.]